MLLIGASWRVPRFASLSLQRLATPSINRQTTFTSPPNLLAVCTQLTSPSQFTCFIVAPSVPIDHAPSPTAYCPSRAHNSQPSAHFIALDVDSF